MKTRTPNIQPVTRFKPGTDVLQFRVYCPCCSPQSRQGRQGESNGREWVGNTDSDCPVIACQEFSIKRTGAPTRRSIRMYDASIEGIHDSAQWTRAEMKAWLPEVYLSPTEQLPASAVRRTKTRNDAETFALREGLRELVLRDSEDGITPLRPMTMRHLYYLAVGAELVDKSDKGTKDVLDMGVRMREEWLEQERNGTEPKGAVIEFGDDWILDAGRSIEQYTTFDSPAEAMQAYVQSYRRPLWDDSDDFIIFAIEKDAIAELVKEVTDGYDVGVAITRGQASTTLCWQMAQAIDKAGKRNNFVYFLHDFDLAGRNIVKSITDKLSGYTDKDGRHEAYARTKGIKFEKIAVTKEQTIELDLPLREPKTKKRENQKISEADDPEFRDGVCEIDTMGTEDLQDLIRETILRHLSQSTIDKIRKRQARERKLMLAAVKKL